MRRRAGFWFALSIAATALLQSACWSRSTGVLRGFSAHGCKYQLAFVETKDDCPWPIDLVMRKQERTGRWSDTARVKQVRLERSVVLTGRRGQPVDALVLSSPGGSAQFITVVEIDKTKPRFRVLLDGEIDKGSFRYLLDQRGRLTCLRFSYSAWHVEARGHETGHVYTARRITWDSVSHAFRRGEVFVDSEAEKKANLVEVLTSIGSDELLGMEETYDERSMTYTFIFRPQGLLGQKTPPEFRWTHRLRAVVRCSRDPHADPAYHLMELRVLD